MEHSRECLMVELGERAIAALEDPVIVYGPKLEPEYWPQEGEAQFLVLMSSQAPNRPIEPFVCWVKTRPVAKHATCWQGCNQGWPMVMASLNNERRAHCSLIHVPCVCKCNGNFIE